MSTATVATTLLTDPFPGLRPFKEEEEFLFFGRESQVDAMVNKLAATRFLAVIGTSGSGKSSLVNCGLRPALHRGLMAGAGTTWRIAQFRPGRNPLRAMAESLAQEGILFREHKTDSWSTAEIIETTLRMSKLGLIDICEQARLDSKVNLLVVVDQFEELFRYRQSDKLQSTRAFGPDEDAVAFVNLLLEAHERETCPIYVVLTMRSDFLGDCAQFAGLPEAINTGQYLVPRMTRKERRAAINGPIQVCGAQISPVLLTRLVNDVGDNPDQLSILQHALNRTWAQWKEEGGRERRLEMRHYEAIGTMAHALDQHAESAYAALTSVRQRHLCEKIFKALTDTVTDPRGVRRPTTLGTLCALADATTEEVTEVIEVFREPSRSFLMPPAGEVLNEETVIDISHESLMRVWERLKTWASQEAESVKVFYRLAETAAQYAVKKASLWRGPELRVGVEWLKTQRPNAAWARRYGGSIDQALAFLDKSRRAQQLRQGATAFIIVAFITILVKWNFDQRKYIEEQTKLFQLSEQFAQEKENQVKDLKRRLDRFFMENPQLRDEVVKMRQDNRELSLQVLEIEHENRDLESEAHQLSIEQKDLERSRDSITITIRSLETQVPKLESEIGTMEEDTTKELELKKKTEEEEKEVHERLTNVRKANQELRQQALAMGILTKPKEPIGEVYGMMSETLRPLPVPEQFAAAPAPPEEIQRGSIDINWRKTAEYLEEENRRLKMTADELHTENVRLRSKVRMLERTRIEYKSTVDKLRRINASLRDQRNQLESRRLQLTQNVSKLQQTRDERARMLQSIRNQNSRIKLSIALIKGAIIQIEGENVYLKRLIETPPPELRDEILRRWSAQ